MRVSVANNRVAVATSRRAELDNALTAAAGAFPALENAVEAATEDLKLAEARAQRAVASRNTLTEQSGALRREREQCAASHTTDFALLAEKLEALKKRRDAAKVTCAALEQVLTPLRAKAEFALGERTDLEGTVTTLKHNVAAQHAAASASRTVVEEQATEQERMRGEMAHRKADAEAVAAHAEAAADSQRAAAESSASLPQYATQLKAQQQRYAQAACNLAATLALAQLQSEAEAAATVLRLEKHVLLASRVTPAAAAAVQAAVRWQGEAAAATYTPAAVTASVESMRTRAEKLPSSPTSSDLHGAAIDVREVANTLAGDAPAQAKAADDLSAMAADMTMQQQADAEVQVSGNAWAARSGASWWRFNHGSNF
jgi:chromosome segregation ATPase